MNAKMNPIMMALLLWALGIGSLAWAQAGGGPGGRKAVSLVPLTDAERTALVHLREEEKLARDVYIAMDEFWGEAVFSRIAVSEQRHMDALLNLLVRYGVDDPVATNPAGVFTDLGLQTLYADLVKRGQLSLLESYIVGRAIEELDIDDLLKAIDGTENADLDRVYTNLLNGSYHHLEAFNFHIDGLQ